MGNKARCRGQSLAEMAVVIPVLVLLLMGGFDATVLISNKITAGYAVRQGARLAAELGGTQGNAAATTQGYDQQIVRNVLAVTRGMTYVTVQEVDIYAPSRADGVYTAGDPLDQYLISGSTLTPGTQTFPVSNRNQIPPTETSIGIRVLWQYSAPAGIFPQNMQLADYAVMKAAPLLR